MSTSTDYLNDVLDRIVAMQEEALASLAPGVTAKPFWPYQQNEFPYFTNRVGPWSQDLAEYGEDVADDAYTILMRLVGAHVDEGYEGEPNTNLTQWMIAVINFFEDRPFLTSTTYATEYDYIQPDGATITSHTGIVIFRNAGVLAQQLGVEFTLELPVFRQVY